MHCDLDDALSRFLPLIDPKVGVIRSVSTLKLTEADPRVFVAYADPCDTTPLTGIAAANRGASCAASLDRAVLRACGECVERYCAAFFDFDDMLLASPRQLEHCQQSYVSPHELYPFADWQYSNSEFPFGNAGSDVKIHWVTARSSERESVAIPASCVYVPYLFQTNVEPFTHMPISTGLAAERNVEACIAKGVCEIVERDALMLVWAARMAVPRIDPASCYGITPEIDVLLDSVSRTRGAWFLNVLTLDIPIPVISAALIDDQLPPLTSFGIAAHADPKVALRSALEEALLTRVLVNRSVGTVVDMAESGAASSPRTLREHLLRHATSGELRTRMEFLTGSGPLVPFSGIDASFSADANIGEICQAAGREVIWFDVTTPDVSECGCRVVRTVMPGMQPLDNDHLHRYLGGKRLIRVPAAQGYAIDSPADLNPDPHPFP